MACISPFILQTAWSHRQANHFPPDWIYRLSNQPDWIYIEIESNLQSSRYYPVPSFRRRPESSEIKHLEARAADCQPIYAELENKLVLSVVIRAYSG